MSPTSTPRYQGFAVVDVVSGPGRDFITTQMTITLDGVPVASSYNSGSGGCDIRHWTDRDAQAKFQNLADTLYPGQIENGDRVALDLITVAEMADVPEPKYILQTEDFWNVESPEWGKWRRMKAYTDEEARDVLRRGRPDALIWDPQAEDFVRP